MSGSDPDVLVVHIPRYRDDKFENGYGISGSKRKKLFWNAPSHAPSPRFTTIHIHDNGKLISSRSVCLYPDHVGTPAGCPR